MHTRMWYLSFALIRHMGLKESRDIVKSLMDFLPKEEHEAYLAEVTHIARILRGKETCGELPKESLIYDNTSHVENCAHCREAMNRGQKELN